MSKLQRVDRLLPIKEIKANPRNARTHSKAQVRQIADSIKGCGFGAPVLVDETLTLIAGHGRFKAAELLGMGEIPAVQLLGLSDTQKRALALADNKVAENAGWDRERLAIELPDLAKLLVEENLDIALTGFSPAELDQLQIDFEEDSADPADEIDQGWQQGPLVSQRGSLWVLDQHRLLCGDARSESDLDRLMGSSRAAMAFLDVPYNVKVKSIGGRGRIKHAEFAFASGEMSRPDYVKFLAGALGNAGRVSRAGAVHYVCCDWRHVTEITEAGGLAYDETLNIVVWVKSNAGQGSFYRSQHEFIAVFRVGEAPHLNNVELGRHGRSRSNVWNYRGVNTFGAGRMEELRSHPTVKPVGLVADALRDCTKRYPWRPNVDAIDRRSVDLCWRIQTLDRVPDELEVLRPLEYDVFWNGYAGGVVGKFSIFEASPCRDMMYFAALRAAKIRYVDGVALFRCILLTGFPDAHRLRDLIADSLEGKNLCHPPERDINSVLLTGDLHHDLPPLNPSHALVETASTFIANDTGERCDYFFEVTVWSGEPYNGEPDKCAELRWFTLSELPGNFVQKHHFGVTYGLAGIRYSEVLLADLLPNPRSAIRAMRSWRL